MKTYHPQTQGTKLTVEPNDDRDLSFCGVGVTHKVYHYGFCGTGGRKQNYPGWTIQEVNFLLYSELRIYMGRVSSRLHRGRTVSPFIHCIVCLTDKSISSSTVTSPQNLGKWPTWRTILFYVFISVLYMFRATPCSSSGESIVSIQPLVYVTLCRWPCAGRKGTFRPAHETVTDTELASVYRS